MSNRYVVTAYYKGLEVRHEYCDNWLEAETVVSDLMKLPSLYDEVRMKKLENDDAELV